MPRLPRALVRCLDDVSPSAAERLREGLDETLTILSLGLSDRLRRSRATTNAAERLIRRTRPVTRNVQRRRWGTIVVRRVAAGVLEAVRSVRRLKGHAHMPTLVTALRARDHRLGFVASSEDEQKIARASTGPPPKFNRRWENPHPLESVVMGMASEPIHGRRSGHVGQSTVSMALDQGSTAEQNGGSGPDAGAKVGACGGLAPATGAVRLSNVS
ncbi:MAG TPA: hypothetical protein PLE61_01025 [Vicinamibacterales bacterium]|nr:hypothetical protein [Vicinamibacterales bacterium]HPW19369.1 hypothetical protein [Vicinamibacterales bacterium]